MALPARDFNQELDKTRRCAHAAEMALRELIGCEMIVKDRNDPSVLGILGLVEIIADRLDDLCDMNAEEAEAAH